MTHTHTNTLRNIKKITSLLGLVYVMTLLSACSDMSAQADRMSRYTGADEFFNDAKKLFDKEKNDLFDPYAEMSREDIKDHFKKAPPVLMERPQVPVLPDVSQLMLEPKPPIVANDKLITISVTDDIPLKDVLIELARKADVDVQIDPKIKGGIIFRAKDRPFSDVIDRITKLAGLRYSVDNGVLSIERDLPFINNYKLDFINFTRTSSSNISVNTQLLGGGDSGEISAGDLSSGSKTELSIEVEDGDLWKTVQEGIENILISFQHDRIQGKDEDENKASSEIDAELEILSVAGGSTETNERDMGGSAVLSTNKHAGLMNILATQRQHDAIHKYLEYVKRSVTSQVLIEAKIVEVSLSDNFRSGIDWSLFSEDLTPLSVTGAFGNSSIPNAPTAPAISFTAEPTELFGFDNTSIEASVQFLQEFGVTRTLSSPRINAMNNQQAVLTFAENFVYFDVEVEVDSQTNTDGSSLDETSADSEIRTIPIGIILSLQPAIDLDKNEVTMSVRPTITRVVRTEVDPAVALEAAVVGVDIENLVPVVEVRELDTVMRVKSGQVLVIGGLIEEGTQNTDNGVPKLADIPWIGNAFKQVNKETDLSELVILIKATIVPAFGMERRDQETLQKFSSGGHNIAF